MDLRKEIQKIQNEFPYQGTDYIDALINLCENYHGELMLKEYLGEYPTEDTFNLRSIENIKFKI
jgi:hypothetical protein